ncbi:hypothetical protein PSHT_13658 [Puccinia striiformis]|uniref:Uncharacterized protein n=2 Tax=Puccinia striiformis TaxID=27350 RepID=A0A2S4UPM6_9BASI|nr:hypothetical protein PSHT_13658 [Puccinia striiformis]POW02908.1 hypothetical protein PSTT_11445 [Puccinia striiformis]
MRVGNTTEHQPLPGGELVELGPMIITGSGENKITRVRYTNLMNIGNPTLELIVAHNPSVSERLSPGKMDIPHDTNFALGSRIALVGHLENLEEPLGLVVVCKVSNFPSCSCATCADIINRQSAVCVSKKPN